jgi:hypothetical protein
MARALGVALALVLIAASPAEAAWGPSGSRVPGAEETVLRLHDLPPGYELFGGSCGPITSSKRGPDPLRAWLLENDPEGCTFEYLRRFRVPDSGPAPPVLLARTIDTPSEAAAARGLELGLQSTFPVSGIKEVGTADIPGGPTARLFRIQDVVIGEGSTLGSMVLWRHGKLIAGVEAGGAAAPANDRLALHFAELQQRRLETPSPLLDAEMDDLEVPLDDPHLKLPVYWPGNPFQPGRGLPVARLEEADTFTRPEEAPPGQKLSIYYDGFGLSSWTRRSWKRFRRSVPGLVNLKDPCAKKTGIDLENGKAVIYSGYERIGGGGCPDRAPTSFWAVAYIGRAVIGVDLSLCSDCFVRGRGGPYDSLRGMKAIVRSLVRRPQPVY